MHCKLILHLSTIYKRSAAAAADDDDDVVGLSDISTYTLQSIVSVQCSFSHVIIIIIIIIRIFLCSHAVAPEAN